MQKFATVTGASVFINAMVMSPLLVVRVTPVHVSASVISICAGVVDIEDDVTGCGVGVDGRAVVSDVDVLRDVSSVCGGSAFCWHPTTIAHAAVTTHAVAARRTNGADRCFIVDVFYKLLCAGNV